MPPFVQLKSRLKEKISSCIMELYPNEKTIEFQIEGSKGEGFGDYTTTVAFSLCKSLKKPPMEVASLLVARLKEVLEAEAIEAVSPGFINLHLSKNWKTDLINEYIQAQDKKAVEIEGLNIDEGIMIRLKYIVFRSKWVLHVFLNEGVLPIADGFNYGVLSNKLERGLMDELVNLIEGMEEVHSIKTQGVLEEICNLFETYNRETILRHLDGIGLNNSLNIMNLLSQLFY